MKNKIIAFFSCFAVLHVLSLLMATFLYLSISFVKWDFTAINIDMDGGTIRLFEFVMVIFAIFITFEEELDALAEELTF